MSDPAAHPRRLRLPSAGCLLVVTLMCVLVALCIVIGWPVHRQQTRLQYFEQVESTVETVPVGPAWLRDLVTQGLGEEYEAGFSEVTWLVLDRADVSNAGLEHLRGCTQLRGLCLANTRITDAGLVHLAGLDNLEVLSLYNTDVSDAGLKYLSGLSGLRKLYLSRTRVTDAGLAHLSELAQLEELRLRQTEVTDAGMAELQSQLPGCDIRASAAAR